jgi:hypothetical protein
MRLTGLNRRLTSSRLYCARCTDGWCGSWELTPETLPRKYLRKGTAVSAAFFTLFSLLRARSVTTEETIPIADYLEGFDPAKLAPIVANSIRERQTRRRQLINLVLLSAQENYRGLPPDSISEYLNRVSKETLTSQVLDTTALELLNSGQVDAFLDHRALLIVRAVEAILAESDVAPVASA